LATLRFGDRSQSNFEQQRELEIQVHVSHCVAAGTGIHRQNIGSEEAEDFSGTGLEGNFVGLMVSR
jgi:hypothetical protein